MQQNKISMREKYRRMLRNVNIVSFGIALQR